MERNGSIGYPIKIIDITHDNKVKLNELELEKILKNRHVRNKKVCFILNNLKKILI